MVLVERGLCVTNTVLLFSSACWVDTQEKLIAEKTSCFHQSFHCELIRRGTREKMRLKEPRVGLLASYERSQASLGASGIFLAEINFQNHL